MGKVTKFCVFTGIVYIFLLLGGCKNTEHVFLENNTSEEIIVKVYLSTKNGEQVMEATIQPDDSDGWSYEIEADENMEIDKKFKNLIITNDKGCKVEINRNEMNKLVSKSGVWKLDIDHNIMNCN